VAALDTPFSFFALPAKPVKPFVPVLGKLAAPYVAGAVETVNNNKVTASKSNENFFKISPSFVICPFKQLDYSL
jgi:hypothetical protein